MLTLRKLAALGLKRTPAVAQIRRSTWLHRQKLRVLHDEQLLFSLKRTQNLSIAADLCLEIKAKGPHVQSLGVKSFKFPRVLRGLHASRQEFSGNKTLAIIGLPAAPTQPYERAENRLHQKAYSWRLASLQCRSGFKVRRGAK
jgi:hypothetical protein